MADNPYITVPSPDYATPVLNLFGDQPKKQQQPQKPGDPQKPADPTQPNYFQMMLQRLFAQNQPGQPMALGAMPPSTGTPGGTGGPLGGLY